MTNFKKTFAKGGIATAAVGAMALASATPVQARDRGDDGISVGDVIAGAVIIGGIAAVASAASKDRDHYRGSRYYRDGRYYSDGRDYRRQAYRSRGNPRAAVEKCVNAARQDARRSGYRFAEVTDIRDVKDTRYGWKVKGRMVVDGQRGYNRYDRYDRRDYRRYGNEDHGKFSCYIERGRVTQVDFSGIRGLR
ncbi:hypothetical protein [Qipengyuania psychrotolerans]|uniref:Uncharacterized protein n=1 Tax=Qipengyuania psychrotolerans TaxID=2867238 RepID=A0ABX8ZAT8_9SPHN|nr:hypothetical protein [Qipengyuania psychrotolerans]QZD86087.1 hypothetical protein K3166_07290 [Qipengyuania psychrotolerans]